MPNYCDNEVRISGDKETLDFIQANAHYSDIPFSMERFKPTPPEVLENNRVSIDPNSLTTALEGDTNYKYDNWYDWRVAHWGTKWDHCDTQVDRFSENDLDITYLTAWAPNVRFWEYFSKLYPTVRIYHRYLEEGMCFIGEANYHDGLLDDTSVDITDEMYIKAGATVDENGELNCDDVSLWDAFPSLDKVKENN